MVMAALRNLYTVDVKRMTLDNPSDPDDASASEQTVISGVEIELVPMRHPPKILVDPDDYGRTFWYFGKFPTETGLLVDDTVVPTSGTLPGLSPTDRAAKLRVVDVSVRDDRVRPFVGAYLRTIHT